ncbi:WYL domain-containing protein [Thermoleophilum album]|uniref:helix-turn-helix transcriptional regulator n=1 Tax=Thermoleophilum album TaxID=29539 RepID=UPI00237C84A0|nr:WYL domain-containing protein [Thermoleophilum album]WDT93560.1 WYL domain-containing protein [Thermoleophilum album]
MAKDTDKLIRQLSLISYLMAERRPVTAVEIKQNVEGYSEMNDEAFARRFYADRAELESLGIRLKVDKAPDGYFEAETYQLPPENFYLPPIEFSDEELAALRTALALLDGEFAYAEPLRLALQHLSWGKPSPLDAPEETSVALAIKADPGGKELSQRLQKLETAIFRRKTVTFDYYTIGRDTVERRKVDPYHLLYKGGQFYLIGYSHERDAVRVFRISRIRGKIGYATKAERDFQRPADFDPREYARRVQWQLGERKGTARIWLSDRIDWYVLRHFGHAGRAQSADNVDDAPGPGTIFETDYADERALIAWLLGLGERARLLAPAELVAEYDRRVALIVERHQNGTFETAPALSERPRSHSTSAAAAGDQQRERSEPAIRPERFARLVTLAGILITAAREDAKLSVSELCRTLGTSEEELRQDIDILNVVNFGGGAYVLYAEIHGDTIEVDPEAYGDNFARPARLLPLEAKALIAAIDLLGEHLPEGSLASAREKIVAALGRDPALEDLHVTHAAGDDSEVARVVCRAITERRLLDVEYYKEHADEFAHRRIEPYKLVNGREGWYVHAWDPERDAPRSFRLDRIKSAHLSDERFTPRTGVDLDLEGWPRTGEVPDAEVARVWISPERARFAREDKRVVAELEDGAVVVALPYAGHHYLVREILKEAGDAVVLEPSAARRAVLEAATKLRTLVRV